MNKQYEFWWRRGDKEKSPTRTRGLISTVLFTLMPFHAREGQFWSSTYCRCGTGEKPRGVVNFLDFNGHWAQRCPDLDQNSNIT